MSFVVDKTKTGLSLLFPKHLCKSGIEMLLRMVRRLPCVRWIYVYESLLDGVLSSR